MSSFETPTIDIVDIAAKLHMPAGREYAIDIVTDGSPTTTGVVRTPQGHTLTSTATGFDSKSVPWVGPVTGAVTGDTSGTHTGPVDLAGDATLGFSAGGAGALASLDVGTVATPEVSLGTGGVRTTVLTIGASGDPPVAGIDATGAATLLSASVGTAGAKEVTIDANGVTAPAGSFGTAGSEEVTIDSTGVTAPEFRGDLDGNAATATEAGSCTGNAATASAMEGALVRTTAEARPCVLVPLTDWAQSTTGPGCALAAEKTDAKLMAQVTEPAGRTVTGWSLAGSYTEAAGVSGAARLYKRVSGVDTAIDDAVSLVKTDGALSASQTLATPEVLAAGASYYVLVTVTTGAGDAAGVESVFVSAK
jgi:hypothetical protein